MGAWGDGNLENDAAMDLLGAIAQDGSAATDEEAVRTPLRAVCDGDADEYLDADFGAEALAAAEIVAAAAGSAAQDADASAREYLATIAARSPGLSGLATLALEALHRVTQDSSELRELWDEADQLDAWLGRVDELRARLRAAA